MDIRTAAQTVRDTVDMDTILSLYGYRTKHGFMVCPFHGERTGSLKIYDGSRGWHCYGCGRGGSVIDFVMQHENCDFPTAVRAIDHACRLGLFRDDENPFKAEDWKNLQQWLDKFAESAFFYCDALRDCIEAEQQRLVSEMKKARDKETKDRTWEECMTLLTFEDDSRYNEYRLEKIEEFREEVAAWRRKARRAGSA